MHVVISNVYGDDNRGGAALTAAAVKAVRAEFPGTAVSLLTFTDTSQDIAVTHRHTLADFPDVDVRPALIPSSGTAGTLRAVVLSLLLLASPRKLAQRHPAGRLIAQADVVIGKGGQMFRTRDGRGLVALWLAMFPLTFAARLGRPTVVYGQAFGPFHGGAGKRFSAMLLRRVDLVLLRDPRSIAIAQLCGIKSPHLREIPDTAFGLDWPSPRATKEILASAGLTGTNYLVVTVTDRMARSTLRPLTLEPLAEVIRGLLAAKAVERAVVVLHADGNSISDACGSRLFVELCDDPRVLLLDDDFSWQSLTALYAAACCVIGGRVHSNILAILAGTPAFPIDYTADKASDIFETFGMADRVVWLDRKSPHEVVQQVLTVLEQGQAARDEIHAARTKLRAHSLEAYRALTEIVDA